MSQPITAWLSIGSTYSYLTALRINAIQRDMSLKLSVKPISIRAIMKSMDNIPFPPSKKTKVDYMWRDIERRADWYGLPKPKLPAPYPLQAFDQANKVGIVLNQQSRYLEYFEETYRLWFVSGMEAGSEENLRLVLKTMTLDCDDVMHQAEDEAIQQMYEANTKEAKQLGVFSAPSFSVGNEIFWGDDRLEDAIRRIQRECMTVDDENTWRLAFISDTGMRLSEATGLHKDDILLDTDIPHIIVRPHPWRRLKTKGSERLVPLVGASLWGAKRLQEHDSTYAFPRYCDEQTCNANSASAALNKWLKPRVNEDAVVHSLRHSMRDRLRAVECPSDIIDQIGGWASSTVGSSYGKGYELPGLAKSMKRMEG